MHFPLIAVLLILLCFYLFELLRDYIGAWAYLLCLIYMCVLSGLQAAGIQSIAFRDSRIIRFLQRTLLNGPSDLQQRERQTMFVEEPHGEACHGFATRFVPSKDGCVRPVASWICFHIPILHELYLLLGVISSNSTDVKRIIASNYDVALIPSGLTGLYHAIVDKPLPAKTIRIYRVGVGFCVLAMRAKMLIEPVLSIREHDIYWKYTFLNSFPFASTFLFFTGQQTELKHGAPIDASLYTDPVALADDVYRSFEELALNSGYAIEIKTIKQDE